MQKTIFKVFAVFMILGLLASALSPLLLHLGSSNSTDANENEIQVETD